MKNLYFFRVAGITGRSADRIASLF